MSTEALKVEKAKKLRLTKPLVRNLNIDTIKSELYDMQEECYNITYYIDTDNDTLLNAFDGEEDEAYEFKMAFSDLCAECDQMFYDLEEAYIPENFDTLLTAIGAGEYGGGYLLWDDCEQDYYGIDIDYSYIEGEAAKRVKRYTKDQILQFYTASLKLIYAYVGLRYRYDSLKAAMDIIKDQNTGVLKVIREIEQLYDKAEKESSGFRFQWKDSVTDLENRFKSLPQEAWLQ